jgi:hypothetical protein
MRTRLAAAALAALTFATSGCGGGGPDEDAQATRAISDSIIKEQKSGTGPGALLSMQRKDADCIGKGLVDEIGVESLRSSDLLTEDNTVKGSVTEAKLPAGDARTATSVLFGCADIEAMVEKGLAKSGNISPRMKPCVNRVVDDRNLRSMFTAYFQGDKNAPQRLVQPMMRCVAGNNG